MSHSSKVLFFLISLQYSFSAMSRDPCSSGTTEAVHYSIVVEREEIHNFKLMITQKLEVGSSYRL